MKFTPGKIAQTKINQRKEKSYVVLSFSEEDVSPPAVQNEIYFASVISEQVVSEKVIGEAEEVISDYVVAEDSNSDDLDSDPFANEKSIETSVDEPTTESHVSDSLLANQVSLVD